MSEAHHRKKDPEHVRQALVEGAMRLAAEGGLATVCVQAVASAAGVTKGAFFHHFASKQALFETVFAEMLGHLDREIDERMAKDPEPYGSYTRAYLESTLAINPEAEDGPWGSLSVSMLGDAQLRDRWAAWFEERRARHCATDNDPSLQAILLASDGIWLADLCGLPIPNRTLVHEHLLRSSYPQPQASLTT